MATELGTLLRGDHFEIDRALRAVLAPTATETDLRTALDGLRLGFTAHAEAEAALLRPRLDRTRTPSALYFLIAQTFAAHLAQEQALAALCMARPGTPTWHDRATYMRELVRHHTDHEEACVMPALRDYVGAEYASMAGDYATERLRALTRLAPVATRPHSLMRL